jgi:hypothetical protein
VKSIRIRSNFELFEHDPVRVLARKFHHDCLNKTETITLAPLHKVMATICIQKYVCNQIQVEKALLTQTVTKQKHIKWENVLSKQGFSLFKTVTEILQRTHYWLYEADHIPKK